MILLEFGAMRAVVLSGLVSLSVGGAAACDAVNTYLQSYVVSAPDGATLVLSDGDKLRLSGIQAPKLYAGAETSMNWPWAEESKAALDDLAAGSRVALGADQIKRDRHGRLIGQAFLEDGTWLQGAMVSAGLARAYSFADTRDCAGELLKAEAEARTNNRGLWNDPFYAIRDASTPETLLPLEGRYELVVGRVLKADTVGSRVYLNFGRYWKEDFTVTIDAKAKKLFDTSGFDPLALENALVRVRGWLEVLDGPRMAVTHPEQIEVLARQ